LKLENLQPIGSFKLRGAGNALLRLPKSELDKGVYTCSAGNCALGVAYACKNIGVKCTIVVPDYCTNNKGRWVGPNNGVDNDKKIQFLNKFINS
jgi:threonine dehydratase